MPAFANTAQLESVIGGLFRDLLADPDIRERFASAGVTVRFVMTDPAGVITVAPEAVTTGGTGSEDGTGPPPPDVVMTMAADVAHAFWLGEVTLPRAMARGDITAEGPVAKILGLLPLLKPAFRLYPKLARQHGVEV